MPSTYHAVALIRSLLKTSRCEGAFIKAEPSTAQAVRDPEQVSDRCYLLRLPPELRNSIITLHLDNVYPGYTRVYVQWKPIRGAEAWRQPYLSQVNRQLRAETLSLWHSLKAFNIGFLGQGGGWEVAQTWLKVNDEFLHQIKSLDVVLCHTHDLFLNFRTSSGSPASCHLEWRRFEQHDCSMARAYALISMHINQLCKSVGTKGFGADDYIRAVQTYLSVAPAKSCDDRFMSDDSDSDAG